MNLYLEGVGEGGMEGVEGVEGEVVWREWKGWRGRWCGVEGWMSSMHDDPGADSKGPTSTITPVSQYGPRSNVNSTWSPESGASIF